MGRQRFTGVSMAGWFVLGNRACVSFVPAGGSAADPPDRAGHPDHGDPAGHGVDRSPGGDPGGRASFVGARRGRRGLGFEGGRNFVQVRIARRFGQAVAGIAGPGVEFEFQQAAFDIRVEQGQAPVGAQADQAGQGQVAGEDIAPVPVALLLEEIAQPAVDRLQVFGVAEPLAVLRVDHNEAGLRRYLGLRVVAHLEFDEASHPGEFRVFLRRLDHGRADVGGDNPVGRARQFRGLGRALELFPRLLAIGLEMHEAEILAQAAGGPAHGDEGTFDGQGAAAAHGIDQWPGAAPRGMQQAGCGQRLVHGRLARMQAIAAAGQRFARGVGVYLRLALEPVQVQDHAGAVGPAVGPLPAYLIHAVHDGVLDPERGEAGIVDGGHIHAGGDAQVAVGIDKIFPRLFNQGRVQAVRRGGGSGPQLQQHALGRAQLEIQGQGVGKGAGYGERGFLQHAGRKAQFAQFRLQYRGGSAGAGYNDGAGLVWIAHG